MLSQALIPPLQHVQSSSRGSLKGVVSFIQYKKIEDQHLLSNETRDSVMPRNKFAKIWKLLDDPLRGASQADAAELRAYASEFKLSPRPSSLYGVDISTCYKHSPNMVLTHQNRIVAVDDLLYDILCFCHVKSNHGDVASTTALVQESYAFVPTALIAEFVNDCPTCDRDLEMDSPSSDKENSDRYSYICFDKPLPNAPMTLPMSMTQSAPGRYQSCLDDGLKSLPMSREVSLYQGIPNGWQYHFPDYESALDGFVTQKDPIAMVRQKTLPNPKKQRLDIPRVPSILPLRSGDTENVRQGSDSMDSIDSIQPQPEESLVDHALAQIDAFSLSFQDSSGASGQDLKQLFMDSLLL